MATSRRSAGGRSPEQRREEAEWVDHLHEHFRHPAVVEGGRYRVPLDPGYSIEMLPESLEEFAFPDGPVWAATPGPLK